MNTLTGKRILISGGTRGIGEAIALRAAQDGAFVAIAAKTTEPHPKLPGTIYSVAKAIDEAGGRGLPLAVDVRDDDAIQAAVEQTVNEFGGLDILINNASAIQLSSTLDTPMKRFDLMFGVNVRATFALSQAALPHLLKGHNPHILNLAPPLNMQAKWFKNHVAYTMSKYGMSMCTLGMAAEFANRGLAVNSLWPKTTIATAAIAVHFPEEILRASRKPSIMADAAHWILTQDAKQCSGRFFIDEEILREQGIEDFSKYALDPGAKLFTDLFLD
ncbi:MAG: NAD(P)-dependent oxidoreductase [Legionellales bacterium]|nr:NAD(P)-dependent oxidoreductase [Legionellales bacterium]